MTLRGLAGAVLVATIVVVSPLARRPALAEPVVPAKDPADALMKRMLDALKADAYDLWIETAPKLTGKRTFETLRAHYGPMLLKGYKTTYLAKLREADGIVHLWKLEPAESREDFEIRLMLKDGRVEAFVIGVSAK
jgi:hypothetical protein